MHRASRPAASIPAPTASLLSAYSWGVIEGTVIPTGAPLPDPLLFGLVRGKVPHRLRDLARVGHEKVFLRRVEGSRAYIRLCDPHHACIEVTEGVLGDDRRHLRPKTSCEVVLIDHHGFARPAHRLQDRFPIQRRQGPKVDDLDADPVACHLLRRLEAVVGHETPGKAAEVASAPPN